MGKVVYKGSSVTDRIVRVLTRGRLTKRIVIMNRSNSLTTYRHVIRKARCVATFGSVRSLTHRTTRCTIGVTRRKGVPSSIASAVDSKDCSVPTGILRPITIAESGVSRIVVSNNFREQSRMCLGVSCSARWYEASYVPTCV